jgi:HSP20 family protein
MSFSPFGKEMPVSLSDLQSELNRAFDRFWHGGVTTGPFDGNAWAPAFDMLEEDDAVVIVAELPGLDAADLELSYQDNRLTIKGHRTSPWPEEAERKLLRRERRYGPFCRTVELPAGVDPEGITATCRHGVMTVTLPKVEKARGKSIKVDLAD